MSQPATFTPRAVQALDALVAALLRTHWAPDQSIAEFQHELDEAVDVLQKHDRATNVLQQHEGSPA